MVNIRYYNYAIKDYGNGIVQVKSYNYGIPTDFENKKIRLKKGIIPIPFTLREKISNIRHCIFESQRRAKSKIFDLSRSNIWEWFMTFTFNPDKIDSFDYSEVSKKMSKWLENVKSTHAPDMKYIVVPELHKSGRFHFHGMFTNIGSLDMVDSGVKTKDGLVIYNVNSFKLGFTTATRIKNSEHTSLYIGKYITKELSATIPGKKRYWRSKNLNEPTIHKMELDFSQKNLLELDRKSFYKKEVRQHFGSFERVVTYYEYRKEEFIEKDNY